MPLPIWIAMLVALAVAFLPVWLAVAKQRKDK